MTQNHVGTYTVAKNELPKLFAKYELLTWGSKSPDSYPCGKCGPTVSKCWNKGGVIIVTTDESYENVIPGLKAIFYEDYDFISLNHCWWGWFWSANSGQHVENSNWSNQCAMIFSISSEGMKQQRCSQQKFYSNWPLLFICCCLNHCIFKGHLAPVNIGDSDVIEIIDIVSHLIFNNWQFENFRGKKIVAQQDYARG